MVVGFIGVFVGLLRPAPGSLGFELVYSLAPRCRRVDWVACGFTRVRGVVSRFIGVRMSSLRRS